MKNHKNENMEFARSVFKSNTQSVLISWTNHIYGLSSSKKETKTWTMQPQLEIDPNIGNPALDPKTH